MAILLRKNKIINIIIYMLLFFLNTATSQSIVKTLPGFDGDLPFKLETGYIGAGEDDELQFFYYFIESEGNPQEDPLVLSIVGGPGCSGLKKIAFETGPFAFDHSPFGDSLPIVVPRPYSWTKLANVIFIDWPVGAGFSYTTNPQAYYTRDSSAPKEVYDFLKKWLMNHPKFIENRLYIEGGSYSGKLAPMIAWEISQANEANLQPQMSLKGFITSNPITDVHQVENDMYQYAHNLALIPHEYLEIADIYCNGEYVNINNDNVKCQEAVADMKKCLEGINTFCILDEVCSTTNTVELDDQLVSEGNPIRYHLPLSNEFHCSNRGVKLMNDWANNKIVREALHVREGTIGIWSSCNDTLKYSVYDYNVKSSAKYNGLVVQKGYHGLITSGDHDLVAPHITTLKWIIGLNLPVDYKWRSWKLEDQVAGFTTRYRGNGSHLTYATIKGSGHTPAMYTPEQYFAMVSRWLSGDLL